MSDDNELFDDELEGDALEGDALEVSDRDGGSADEGGWSTRSQTLPLLNAALDSIRVGKLTLPPREVKAKKHKVALVVKANLMQYVRACVDDIGAGILRSLVDSPYPVFSFEHDGEVFFPATEVYAFGGTNNGVVFGASVSPGWVSTSGRCLIPAPRDATRILAHAATANVQSHLARLRLPGFFDLRVHATALEIHVSEDTMRALTYLVNENNPDEHVQAALEQVAKDIEEDPEADPVPPFSELLAQRSRLIEVFAVLRGQRWSVTAEEALTMLQQGATRTASMRAWLDKATTLH